MDNTVLVLALENLGIQMIWLTDQKEYYIPDTKNVSQIMIVSGILMAVIDNFLIHYQTTDGTLMHKWAHSVNHLVADIIESHCDGMARCDWNSYRNTG
jgi:hypothetical protein